MMMRPRISPPRTALAAAAAVALVPGCGGDDDCRPRRPISGAVTLDGKSLETGSIQFQPDGGAGQGALGTGAVIEGGRYQIARERGLTPGSYKVVILSRDRTAKIEEDTPGGASACRPS